jgi:hypothetical protein
VRDWIARQVEITGVIEQPHVRPWATALRVPTAGGTVWFKASLDAYAHEAEVIRILTPLAPGLLPEVIASRGDGWMLLADAGDRAREHPIDWPAMLREYVRLQAASAAHVDELLAAGVNDNRPQRVVEHAETLLPLLPEEVARGVRERLPDVGRKMGRLAASRLPVTVDHNDLHDGNVFSRHGRVRIIDWGDSSVAHPFFTMSVFEQHEVAPYLAAWEGFAPREELQEEAAIVSELRFLVRALNWADLATYGPQHAAHLVDRIERFLN